MLLKKLQIMGGIISSKQNMPILNGVLIEAQNNKIKLTTTNLNTTIITRINTNNIENGKTVVLFRQLTSIVRELPQREVTLQLTKNNLLISCENIKLKINTFNPDEFPKTEVKKETALIKIDPQELLYIIKLTSFCVGQEDVNYVLNGILFEINNDNIIGVSTDAKRLAMVKRKLPANQPEIKTKIIFILPLQTINELQKIVKDVTSEIFFYINKNNVGFDLGDSQIITRIIEGEFPDYNQYVPQPKQDKLIINRETLLSDLRRAALFSTFDYQSVKIELKKDKITILKATPQIGEVKEEIKCAYSGPSFPIGFNPVYLIDVLKNIDEENVSFEFFGADKPAILRKKDYVYLVLPMKI